MRDVSDIGDGGQKQVCVCISVITTRVSVSVDFLTVRLAAH